MGYFDMLQNLIQTNNDLERLLGDAYTTLIKTINEKLSRYKTDYREKRYFYTVSRWNSYNGKMQLAWVLTLDETETVLRLCIGRYDIDDNDWSFIETEYPSIERISIAVKQYPDALRYFCETLNAEAGDTKTLLNTLQEITDTVKNAV